MERYTDTRIARGPVARLGGLAPARPIKKETMEREWRGGGTAICYRLTLLAANTIFVVCCRDLESLVRYEIPSLSLNSLHVHNERERR